MSMILASGSPRRRELLSMITPDFRVEVSDFDESVLTAPTPKQTAENLAFGKCMAVAGRFPGEVVIGCDTVVEYKGKVFGKPHSKEDARAMLTALAGADHYVHTGVCVWANGSSHTFTATNPVRFFPLTEAQIEAYIATDEPYDKAGGYGIQGAAALFCEEIEGCYYNVMGLPVSRLARKLDELGVLTGRKSE